MSETNSSRLKNRKNCLLVFRNKKINNFEGANGVIKAFSSFGYYFDKISYVAYDRAEEIINSLKEGKENYENVVIYCPISMEKTLKAFINALYNSDFNELGILKSENSHVFIMYSDHENRLRFDDIKKIFDAKYGVKYEKACVRLVGAPSKEIKYAIQKAINAEASQSDIIRKLVNFNVSDNFGDCTIEVVYSEEIKKSTFDKVFRTLVSSLTEYIYSIDNYSLAERLYQMLKLRRMKISVAESFTGGGISKKLVEISGISEVFNEGLNTYSNEAKIKRLGVNEFTVNHYGAVSEQTAQEMAEGLIRGGDCDVSIATTGIAGPKSDNSSKPVGLVYIAIGTRENVCIYKYNLKGNRENVTNTAINLALFLAYKTLK